MSKRAIRYAVIDAFTKEAFKGNPAAVCFLEENSDIDKHWIQSVVQEFNAPAAAFVSPVISAIGTNGQEESSGIARFNIRWFAHCGAEVPICGHATLATAHFLFSSDLAEQDTIEFVSKWGLLLARKIIRPTFKEETFTVELDFPVDPVVRCDVNELPCIPLTLNGVPIINVMKTTACGDLIVELPSSKDVAKLQPNFMEIKECAGRCVAVTGPAPDGCRFDFFTRFFCPKLGVDEDQVCDSIHCALVPYWSEKLKKKSLTSYMASQRSGVLHLELDEESQRVRISGEAVTVMVGTILV
ncbi:Phenazine biosynthesis-like domain-containing protein [Rhynchospora pubera]|uniref:Phenazine biosynthesis-like domain-containing protein n=1 Tax=Rhynchospora pubera TaxID=906938 RepID=A0AAV8EN74_9POAL|nr:Phenazine biosynthesis-like domain-containing protein [Rhynchospora pubera]